MFLIVLDDGRRLPVREDCLELWYNTLDNSVSIEFRSVVR